jgi:branched-chain amino acid aminotransferase
MATRVWIDGAIYDEHEAVVPVFDRGFLYGDSVYEVARTAGGRPVDLARHLDRLARSAAAIGMDLPPRGDLEDAVRRTLEAAGNIESYVRVVVTPRRWRHRPSTRRSPIGRASSSSSSRWSCPPPSSTPRAATSPWSPCAATRAAPLDPAVKSGNYLNNIMALAEARRGAAYESIMLNPDGAPGRRLDVQRLSRAPWRGASGHARPSRTGSSTASPAAASSSWPPPPHCRRGRAPGRGTICAAPSRPSSTSSLRGILPIARVDDRALAAAPGPLTRELMRRYDGFLDAVARGVEDFGS